VTKIDYIHTSGKILLETINMSHIDLLFIVETVTSSMMYELSLNLVDPSIFDIPAECDHLM